MNQLNVSLQHSIITLAAKGWSARKIARELDIHRETVCRYLRSAQVGSKPANVPTGSGSGSRSQCDPWAGIIEEGLQSGLSAQRIYQDLVAAHGFGGGYDAVKRYVRRLGQRTQPPGRRIEMTLGHEI